METLSALLSLYEWNLSELNVFFVVNLGQLLVILDPMTFIWCYCNITKWLHPFPIQIHDFEMDYLIPFYRKNKCNLFPMFFIYCIFTFDDMVSRVICCYHRNTKIELMWLHGPVVPSSVGRDTIIFYDMYNGGVAH